MKPLHLEIAAFGPFAGVEEIDFEEIEGRSLLLIHGPTGSGKTTILDAICFALFGDTSANEREAKQMRCDGALAGQSTYVVYEFSLGERRYRVQRFPEQEQAKKRGEGTTTIKHKAELWALEGSAAEGRETRLLASGASKVKEAVSDLFGFQSEQFRQVMLLPQGRFRQFLTASTREREKILEELFDSKSYAKVEIILAAKVKALDRKLNDERVLLDAILSRADVESLEALKEAIEVRLELRNTAESGFPQIEKAKTEADAALEKGRRDSDKFAEHTSARKGLSELENKETEIEEMRRKCANAVRTLPLNELDTGVRARAKETEKARKEAWETELLLKEAQNAHAIAKVKLETVREKDRSRGEKNQQLANLKSMMKRVERLDIALQDQEEAEAEDKACVHSLEESHDQLRTETKIHKEAQRVLGDAKEQSAKGEGLALERDRAQNTLEKKRKFVSSKDRLKQCNREKSDEERACAAMNCSVEERSTLLVSIEKDWQDGQAGALAQTLKEASPCPVCGGVEHPKPAVFDRKIPSTEELNTARKRVENARLAAKKQHEKALAASSKVEVEASVLSVLREELGEAEAPLAVYEKAVAEAEAALHASLQAEERGMAAQTRIEKSKKHIAEIEAAIVKKSESRVEAAKRLARTAALATELSENIPDGLKGTKPLGGAIDALEKLLKALQIELDEAQNMSDFTSKGLVRLQQKEEGAHKQFERAEALLRDEQEELVERCTAAGFGSIQEYREARLKGAELDALQKRVSEYDGNRKAATDRLARSKATVEGLEIPQIETLEAIAIHAGKAHKTAIERWVQLRADYLSASALKEEFESLQIKIAEIEKEWKVVASVSDLANGKVPPQKLSFQRFVLGAYLDEVLLAASERLMAMSNRRYRLTRQDQSRHRGRAGGLDLEVIDSYSGVSRSVTTLSGGESFLAALSLSLGMADVIQSYSGGCRLDTLFIDEGFGTLDSSALDLALNTLTELNTGGRLVGIISHVDELKMRIPTRLEVQTSSDGSTTRFVRG